jgi:acyl carrier protein
VSAPRARHLTDAAILEGIREVARRHLGWSGPIRKEQRIVETLRLDSLRLLTLVVEVENHFRICLDQGSESDIVTVRDLVDEIRRKLEPPLHGE